MAVSIEEIWENNPKEFPVKIIESQRRSMYNKVRKSKKVKVDS